VAVDPAAWIARQPRAIRGPGDEERQWLGSPNRTGFWPHDGNVYTCTVLAKWRAGWVERTQAGGVAWDAEGRSGPDRNG
jgi:hypothetical protein